MKHIAEQIELFSDELFSLDYPFLIDAESNLTINKEVKISVPEHVSHLWINEQELKLNDNGKYEFVE
jgi:hypothetical protein